MSMTKIRQAQEAYYKAHQALKDWAKGKIREIDGGAGWTDMEYAVPEKDLISQRQYRRIDKIVTNTLRPSQKNAIFIEYLSPANNLEEKHAIWDSGREDATGYDWESYHTTLTCALAVVDALKGYWER